MFHFTSSALIQYSRRVPQDWGGTVCDPQAGFVCAATTLGGTSIGEESPSTSASLFSETLCPPSVQRNIPPPTARNCRRSVGPPKLIGRSPPPAYFEALTVSFMTVGWIVQTNL